MGEWQKKSITEIAQIISGGTPKTDNAAYWNGDIPWLSVADFNNELRWVDKAEKSITEFGLSNSATKVLEVGDIIISARGTVGALAQIAKPMAFNQSCYGLRANPEICEQGFFYYSLKSGVSQILQSTHGSVFDTITKITFDNLFINLPPLPEQRAISEVLSSLDDKIDLLHRQNQTLEALAETLFRRWFIEEADPDWEIVTVGSVAKTNVRTVKTDYPYTAIKYLDTGSITKGKIESLQPYEIKDAPSRAKRLVEHNDIIISTVRPNHKHYGFIKNPQPDLVVSTGFCVITCFGIDPHYMYCLMTQEEMTEYLSIVAEASTSTYPSLKPSDIEAIEFQLPPIELLNSFSAIATDNWTKIETNYAQILYLKKTRDALLPKLMSGEVRVSIGEGNA